MATIAEKLTKVNAIKEEIQDILSTDSEVLQTYPNKIAKAICDTPSEQVFMTRTTANGGSIKDGVAWVDKVKGKTIKWNQLVNKAILPNTTTMNGVTFTNNGDGTITANGTALETNPAYINISYKVILNHKYLLLGTPKGGSQITFKSYTTTKLNIVDVGNGITGTADGSGVTYHVVAYIYKGYTANNLIFRPMCFDLTAMGWEDITTADQFAQRLGYADANSMPYLPYDEGSLLSFNGKNIVSKGEDNTTIGTLPLNISSIKDTQGNTLFPYGLLSAGSVYDEITENKAIKRVGVYTFTGNENILYFDVGSSVNTATFNFSRYHWQVKNDRLSNKLDYLGAFSAKAHVNETNKIGFALYWNPDSLSAFVYINTNLSSANEVMAWLKDLYNAGTPLIMYLDLATPVEVDIQQKMWYKVENGGTETIEADVNTTPLTADIGYRSALSAEEMLAMLDEATS